MNPWRRYIIRLILAVLFLLFALLLNDVAADIDGRSDHRFILDLGDELEDDLSESERVSEDEDLEIFHQVPRKSEEGLREGREWENESEFEGDLIVDDVEEEEEVIEGFAETENYEDLYGGPEYNELPHCQQDKEDEGRPRSVGKNFFDLCYWFLILQLKDFSYFFVGINFCR